MGKRLRVSAVHSNRINKGVRKDEAAVESWKKLPRKAKQKIAKKLASLSSSNGDADGGAEIVGGQKASKKTNAGVLKSKSLIAQATAADAFFGKKNITIQGKKLLKKGKLSIGRRALDGSKVKSGLKKTKTSRNATRMDSDDEDVDDIMNQDDNYTSTDTTSPAPVPTSKFLFREQKKEAKKMEQREQDLAQHNAVMRIPEYRKNPLHLLKQHLLAST
ncbi:unnamed protein product [Amoebophrya sp. A25]|nr:unnamed protein product [Amoebophrya sp. A25]|eukprot:GSA25T00003263001.1